MLQQITLLLAFVCATTAWKAPDYVTVCKRYDPDLNSCWRKNFETVVPKMGNGIPELHLVPINPATWDLVELKMGEVSDPLYLKGFVRNSSVYGLVDTKLVDVDIDLTDPKNMKFSTNMSVPHLNYHGSYNGKGKVLFIDINAKGKVLGEIHDGFMALTWNVSLYKKKGVSHFKFEVKDIDMRYGKVNIKLTNLFEGNEELTNSINQFVNENIDSIFVEFKPVIEETLTGVLNEVVGQFLEVVPADEMYPID